MTAAPPTTADRLARLLVDFDAGKPAALARAVSMVENQRDGFEQLLTTLHPRVGRARRIGVTGPPGAGKSTLSTRLVNEYRAAGLRVGVIAVDPTSPFTGGALLGDRVRMESVALDPGVFIRSLATRGSLGGVSSATRAVADVLDAFGFDRIIIETVGVGQSELDIARTADSTIVVLVPESGDSIQALKAGLMEIADLFVVNKADRPGADETARDLAQMLRLGKGRTAWVPPIVRTSAQTGDGLPQLLDSIAKHRAWSEESGERERRRREAARAEVESLLREELVRRLAGRIGADRLEAAVARVADRAIDPYAAVEELLGK